MICLSHPLAPLHYRGLSLYLALVEFLVHGLLCSRHKWEVVIVVWHELMPRAMLFKWELAFRERDMAQ